MKDQTSITTIQAKKNDDDIRTGATVAGQTNV